MPYRAIVDDTEWVRRQDGETREDFIIRTTKMAKDGIDMSDIAKERLAGNEEALKRLAEALGE